MESIPISRKRLKNRKRKRQIKKNKRFDRDRLRFEVKSKEHQKIVAGSSAYVFKNKQLEKSMDAEAFWQNYSTAEKWQQKHNVTWWKSRCKALEEENQILRSTVRKLSRVGECQCQRAGEINNIFLSAIKTQTSQQSKKENHIEFRDEIQTDFRRQEKKSPRNIVEEVPADEEEHSDDDESLEFQINEDMMDFLKQSIQHKMELKQQREEEEEALKKEEEAFPLLRVTSTKERVENAKLLYGEASPRILGMETALQATIDSHRDKTRPSFWPNIPLKL